MTAPHYRWAILALLFASRVGLGFQFQTMGSVGEPVAAALGLNYAAIGSLIGFFLMPGLVLALPAGLLGRWLSDRVLVTAGLLALAAGGGLAAIADGFTGIAAGRLVCGAGFVLTTLYFTKMAADWFAGRELATAMAVVVMSWPFGIALGQVAHGWLALHHGWRTPFLVASAYCLLSALALFLLYRPPPAGPAAASQPASARLTAREWRLTLIAAVAWAAFNAGYVVYLSFAPKVLTEGGIAPLAAASTISVASWVMIVSGALCGQLADRTGRVDLILSICLAVGVVSLALLPEVDWALPLSLAYGLVGMAPAGLIMALTGQAMAPNKRAFGMGVFLSVYFLLTAPAPGIAGWLFDRSHDAFLSIQFAIALFVLTLFAVFLFRWVQRRGG